MVATSGAYYLAALWVRFTLYSTLTKNHGSCAAVAAYTS